MQRTSAACIAISLLLWGCAAKTPSQPHRPIRLIVTKALPPTVIISDSAGREVFGWVHADNGRVKPLGGNESYQAVEGDQLLIEFDQSRARYRINSRDVFASSFNPSEQYRFKLTIYDPQNNPAVFEGSLR